MQNIEDKIRQLPPELQKEIEDFLWEKKKALGESQLKLDWRGELRELRDKYTSVDLQHKVLHWWGE